MEQEKKRFCKKCLMREMAEADAVALMIRLGRTNHSDLEKTLDYAERYGKHITKVYLWS